MKNLVKETLSSLDPSIETAEARVQHINTLNLSNLSSAQLDKISNYIIEGISHEERKQHKIITNNRKQTINKRETSYESLVNNLEGGEDALYNYINNDKNQRLTHERKLAAMADLQQLQTAISQVETQQLTAESPKDKRRITRQLIELRKDQYLLNPACSHPMIPPVYQKPQTLDLSEERWLDENQEPQSNCIINLFNENHVAAVLKYHRELAIAAESQIETDMYYFLQVFNILVKKTLQNNKIIYNIFKLKYKKKSLKYIQAYLQKHHNISLSESRISQIWTTRIPKLIARKAKEEYILETYSQKGKVKQCSRCKKYIPLHHYFFSRNRQSKDGFYSMCKKCRTTKKE